MQPGHLGGADNLTHQVWSCNRRVHLLYAAELQNCGTSLVSEGDLWGDKLGGRALNGLPSQHCSTMMAIGDDESSDKKPHTL